MTKQIEELKQADESSRDVKLITSQSGPTSYRFGIASEENGLMGSAIAEMSFEVYTKWILQSIKIDPIFRGKGYGSKLLDYACDRLSHIGPDAPILVNPALPGFMDGDEILRRMKDGDVSVFDESVSTLMDWYRRHGFSGDKITMVKAPFKMLSRRAYGKQ